MEFLKDDGQPIFCKARTVPYAIKEQVEKELRKLVERGVLKSVKHSSWAAPIVVVPKADTSVRICGDYKMTVNRVISENSIRCQIQITCLPALPVDKSLLS